MAVFGFCQAVASVDIGHKHHYCGTPCRSRMVRGLARPLLYVTSVATAVALYESAREVSNIVTAFGGLRVSLS